jgi:hypothetical protein
MSIHARLNVELLFPARGAKENDMWLSGYLGTLVGNGTAGLADGTGVQGTMLSGPLGVAVDTLGNVYVADRSAGLIRAINTAGKISTLAGLNLNRALVDGSGTNARFYDPYGMVVSADRSIYVADCTNGAIRKVLTSGSVSTLFQQSVFLPAGVALSTGGTLYVSSATPNVVSIISTSGTPTRTVFVGQGTSGFANGQGTQAYFCTPFGIVFSTAGVLYVADYCNHCIRMVTTNGKI